MNDAHDLRARWGPRLAWTALIGGFAGVALLLFGTSTGAGTSAADVHLEIDVTNARRGGPVEGAHVSVVESARAAMDPVWIESLDGESEASLLAASVRGLMAHATTAADGTCALRFSDVRCRSEFLADRIFSADSEPRAWGPVDAVCVISRPGFRPVRVDLASRAGSEEHGPGGPSITLRVAAALEPE